MLKPIENKITDAFLNQQEAQI